ncbi:hypothetical protein HanRHA438_Chr02g0048461 [Helianthus annuus]|nr:hypothetical protein HanRHA438_Chr02g0048461 [Helianthus annuus]
MGVVPFRLGPSPEPTPCRPLRPPPRPRLQRPFFNVQDDPPGGPPFFDVPSPHPAHPRRAPSPVFIPSAYRVALGLSCCSLRL